MRVLMLTAHWPPRLSGHGDYCQHLAGALRDAGVELSVLVLGQPEASSLAGVEVSTTAFPSSVRALGRVRQAVEDRHVDVVLVQFEANAFELSAVAHLLPLAVRSRRRPTVLMYHELWPSRRFPRLAKGLLLNSAQRVVVFTPWHAEGVGRFRKWGSPADIIPVASNVANSGVGDRRIVRARFGLEATDLVATFFGFIIPEHCVHELIAAAAMVRHRAPTLRLSIVGAFDPVRNGYHQRLSREAREAGVDDVITWHDRVEDPAQLARLFAITDLGVLPYQDGVGENNGAFAALASFGIPIVTTCGPRSEPMEQARVALFTHADRGALAEAISTIVADDSLRTELGRTAEAWSARRRWRSLAEQFLPVLEAATEDVA